MLSTTELFVEHIISGILSLVWITAIIFSFTGVDISVLPVIHDFWGLSAVVATAIAYPVGIFIDTIADKMLESWNQKIKTSHGLPNDFSLLTHLHTETNSNTVNYFTYNRFKTRVARSSFINFAMIGFAVALFIIWRGSSIGINHQVAYSVAIFVTFNILSATALFLWREIANTVYASAGKLWGKT